MVIATGKSRRKFACAEGERMSQIVAPFGLRGGFAMNCGADGKAL
jgi:hypothetical protein